MSENQNTDMKKSVTSKSSKSLNENNNNTNNNIHTDNEDEEEEENEEYSDDELSYNQLQIKKENLNYIKIDIKTYNKILSQLANYVKASNEISNNVNYQMLLKKKSYTESFTQTNKEIYIIPIDEYDKTINDKDEKIRQLTIENDVLKGQVENLEKNNGKLLNDISNLKQNSKEKIDKLIKEITQLKNNLENINYKYTQCQIEMKSMKKISPVEQVLYNEKLINNFLKYLPFGYILTFCSLNKYLHCHFYYKQRTNFLEKQVEKMTKSISYFTSKNISQLYDIENKKIIDIIDKYTLKENNNDFENSNIQQHIIPGNLLRYRIIHSLIFLDKIIKDPIRKLDEKNNLKNDKSMFKNLINSMVNIITDKDENLIENKIKNIEKINELHDNVVTFPNISKENVLLNTKENNYITDDKIYNYFMDNKNISFYFEYNSPNQIKSLIEFFLNSNFDGNIYSEFLKYFVDEYCELLCAAFSAVSELKEIEIANLAIDIRYKKLKYLCSELKDEVTDLNKFAEGNKQIKEMLLKQKNEVEIKYNDSLINITNLNIEKQKLIKNIEDIDNERINNEKEYASFKNTILNKYKTIQNDCKNITRERDLLINTIIDFKNYFLNFVSDDGDIL